MNTTRYTFKLGDVTASLYVSYQEQGGMLYLNLHENEQTSVSAAKEILKNKEGILAELKSKGERLISFKMNSVKYSFDPNRMFSDAGIKASLEEYSVFKEEAAQEISAFAANLLKVINEYSFSRLITLHNTSGEYSIEGYGKDGPYEKDAAEIFVNDKHARGDFFFTSDEGAFTAIKNAGYNVVLQNNREAKDDGSLSVYCGKKGIPYINCEALHGHLQEQAEMLEFIRSFGRHEFHE